MRRAVCAAAAVALAGPGCVVVGRSSAEPLPPSPARVEITLVDFRFEVSAELTPGRVVVEVANRGTVNHSLNLIVLPEDFPPLDRQLRGEERRGVPTLAQVPTRRPGQASRFALDLRAGRYGLVCFVVDADGLTHGEQGMNHEFRVR
ncbi:MAG: hypothetical protein ACLGI2_01125 [Acidimicrobiia bacterium]